MSCNSDSLRKKVFDDWVKNPYTRALKICETHHLDYKIHGKYINRLLSEFRSYHSLGLPQKAQRLEHRVFEWGCISRGLLPGRDEDVGRRLEFWGWKEVSNNNGMWTFKGDPRGTVHWYKEGLVRLYLKGELQLASAKELFCHAFRWFEPKELSMYLDVPLKETFRKWVFEIGSPMPKIDIRSFERSHGLHIFTDLSHRTSLHVGEATPFWIGEQRMATAELGGVVQQLGVEIQEHLKLIKMWQEEATAYRKDVRSNAPETAPNDAPCANHNNGVSFRENEFNDFLHEY